MFTPFLIAVWLLTFVAGQLLLKPAMDGNRPLPRGRRIGLMAASIASMTVSFFLGIGLLQKLELSYLFPFQALSVILITIFATLFLKERLTVPLAVGAILITVGVMLISGS